jgi:hypothetical protein
MLNRQQSAGLKGEALNWNINWIVKGSNKTWAKISFIADPLNTKLQEEEKWTSLPKEF